MSSNVILEFWCGSGSGSMSGSRSQKSLATSHKFDTGKISELVWEKIRANASFFTDVRPKKCANVRQP